MEEVITEGIKFNKGSKALNHYLKIYYKKMPKIKMKLEKGENKKAEDLLADIDDNVAGIKEMKNELAELETKFANAKSKEEKQDLKEKYKDVYKKYKPLMRKVVTQTDKLNHTWLKAALGGAAVFYLIQFGKGVYDTYQGMMSAFDQYAKDQLGKEFGPMITASTVTEEINYFPY